MTHRPGLLAALVGSLAACLVAGPVWAGGDHELPFDSTDRGPYFWTFGDPSIERVEHDDDNDYFVIGQDGFGKPPGEEYFVTWEKRPFFIYTVPPIDERVTKAELRIAVPDDNYGSTDATETVTFYDITSDLDDVMAGGDDTDTVIAIFQDLGEGVVYGTHVSSAADDGTTIHVPLNATFRALARKGGRIGIGAAVTTLSSRNVPSESFWGTTTSAYQTSLVLTIRGAQPDAWIKRSSGAWSGDDVFNTTAVGQSASASAKPGKTVTYYLAVENAGRTSDRWYVKGPGSTSAFRVKYLVGTTDVTSKVVTGTYQTSRLPSGGFEQVEVRVNVKAGAPAGAKLTQKLIVRSSTIEDWVDAVKAVTRRS